MEPIISPWIIYALHVFDKVYFTCEISLMCCGIISPLLVMAGEMEGSECMLKYAKILAIVAAVCALVLIIVPNKETLIAMLVTTYITPDNIQVVQGNIIDFVQQIIKATKNIK